MFSNRIIRTHTALSILLPTLLMTACVEHTIETTINLDGSGVRVERMEVSENGDGMVRGGIDNIEEGHFPLLMNVTESEGWDHTEEVDADNDSIHVFRRRTEIGELAAWSNLNGKVKIAGTLTSIAPVPVGYVRLGEVRFFNTIRVRRAADSEGPTAFTFRETFAWDRAADALTEFLMGELAKALAVRYPKLSVREIGEVVGFARARFWVAIEDGLLSGDGDEDQLMSDVVRITSTQAIKTVRVQYPALEERYLSELLTDALVDSDDRLVAFLEEQLPGVNIALNSEIVFRLNMPGRVTNSNSHKRDGNTLIWEFGPADAFYIPVEIFAESVVGG